MPPQCPYNVSHSQSDCHNSKECSRSHLTSLIEMAATELEKEKQFSWFPPACYQLLTSIQGNSQCVDCGDCDPQWASVTYGTLLCLRCSGRHRSMGVKVSFVRSIHMDSWTPSQILSMLEGGNAQLSSFFERHELSHSKCQAFVQRQKENNNGEYIKDLTSVRYETNAARFYRNMLTKHVNLLKNSGPYKGREESRKKAISVQRQRATAA
mmetsp:Transcript_19831/g.28759  ORF Transcript_19831/g.28759 Transcript_19831/m.28759 type:complete len:210 (+) Transcript_19831:73-702(+)